MEVGKLTFTSSFQIITPHGDGNTLSCSIAKLSKLSFQFITPHGDGNTFRIELKLEWIVRSLLVKVGLIE